MLRDPILLLEMCIVSLDFPELHLSETHNEVIIFCNPGEKVGGIE